MTNYGRCRLTPMAALTENMLSKHIRQGLTTWQSLFIGVALLVATITSHHLLWIDERFKLFGFQNAAPHDRFPQAEPVFVGVLRDLGRFVVAEPG